MKYLFVQLKENSGIKKEPLRNLLGLNSDDEEV